MASIDYEIAENLQISIEELSNIFNMQKASVIRSLNSKGSFFNIDRLSKLYKWFIGKQDPRTNTVEEKLQDSIGYFPVIKLEEFVIDLHINIGLLITEGTSKFADLLIAHDNFNKLGIVTSSAKLMSLNSPKVMIEWNQTKQLVNTDYLIYNDQQSPEVKSVILIGDHIYKIKPSDTEKVFGHLNTL